MLASLTQTMGNVSASADACDIDPSTHYAWLKKDEKYADKVYELRERALDFAEGALMKCIQNGKESSIQFFLKMKGKHRGYVETKHNLNTDIPKDDMKDKTVEELLAIINGED